MAVTDSRSMIKGGASKKWLLITIEYAKTMTNRIMLKMNICFEQCFSDSILFLCNTIEEASHFYIEFVFQTIND